MKHTRNLKQSLVLKKFHRVIKFNQNTWIKAYIYMNPDQRKSKNDFKDDFFRMMNNAVFMRKYKGIKLNTIEKRRNFLVLEPTFILQSFLQNIC